MTKTKHSSSFWFTEDEIEVLKQYAFQEGRTQTGVLREFVRSLKRKLKTKPQ